jgi:hypothetical protein
VASPAGGGAEFVLELLNAKAAEDEPVTVLAEVSHG